MKKLYALLLIALLSSCVKEIAQTEQGIKMVKPEVAGFSGERLARLDSTMSDWVKKGWINGAVGYIARDGKIVYYKASGYNNLEIKEKLKEDEGID